MRLLVISDAPILRVQGTWQAYAPYVKEMDIWMSQAKETVFVCPTRYRHQLLKAPFARQDFYIRSLRRLEFHTLWSAIVSIGTLPYQFIVILVEMIKADHIHLRAPGNLCVLACMAQVLLSRKRKTVKYAGNWDPKSKQPLAYRLQKWMLSNTLLTKNIKVLVYGTWQEQSKNITPFFTATYRKAEAKELIKAFEPPFKALFVGTMGPNKRPLETAQFIKKLRVQGVEIVLDMYGEGTELEAVRHYCEEEELLDVIRLKGNQAATVIQDAYKNAHFVILFSKSEGWPKVVAEAMFWGAIPVVTPVSCVPWMLDHGSRGFLLKKWDNKAAQELSIKLQEAATLKAMSVNAQKWSQHYTIDRFEEAIKQLV